MSECTHDCSSCGESCASREPQSLLKAHHADAHVGKVYGIVSGKGGVGKSMVTSQLAVTMRRRGYQVGILDADITGPSIPKAFGIHDRAMGTENALIPSESKTGIQVMSINLLLENETDPVIWRGPVISGVVQQFWTDVLWNCDYHRGLPPRFGGHGGRKGCQDGGDDECPHRGSGGKHELCGLPGLRQEDLPLRRGQNGSSRCRAQPASSGGNAHRSRSGIPDGRRQYRGFSG